MPQSRSQILNEIRQADPRAKDVPDDELAGALAQKYPQYATVLTKKQFPIGSQSRRSEANLRNIALEQSKATFEQEKADAESHALGQAAEMLPFAAAAPFTGGASLGAGLGLMGAAGVAGGLMREGTKAAMGSSQIPQTPKALAQTLGVDAVTGMVGEGVGRIGTKVVTALIPQLIQRSAVAHTLGHDALQKSWDATRGELDTLTSGTYVDVTGAYHKFHDAMAALPKGEGATGTALTAFKDKVATVLNNVSKDLKISGGGTSVKQRLDSLIEMKGQLNSIAWDKELNQGAGRQLTRLKALADDLNGQIKAAIKTLPNADEAMALYDKSNSFMKILNSQNVGLIMTEKMLGRMFSRGAIGAAALGGIGGYEGYRKGGITGALEYGAAGAVSGAAAGAMQAAVPRISTWVFELMAKHPKTASYVKEAIELYGKGESENANALMVRAAGVAEVRDAIKEAIRHPAVLNPEQPQP